MTDEMTEEKTNVVVITVGGVRFSPASATEALHTIFPHVKIRAGPGCPALAADTPAK
jgi:hypothetical protein